MRARWGVAAGLVTAALVVVGLASCAKKGPQVAKPLQPKPAAAAPSGAGRGAAPAQAVKEAPIVPVAPLADDSMSARSLDDLNRDSPLQPVFFDYDQSEITAEGQGVLNKNAEILKRYPTWIVNIEGHCDERGTPEYNLSLGERRAVAARAYLVSLGISADRVKTASYGSEFPFDPGHDEAAWARNRRAHFVITQK